ncbi:MAG: BatD family protein [Sandaracinaceae bacterium]
MKNAIAPTLFTLALLGAPGPAAAAVPPRVEARLTPRAVAVGEAALLSVTVSGDAAGAPTLPRTPGLEVTPIGTAQQMTIVNGAVDRSVTYRYQVRPTRPGRFSIGAMRVGGASSEPVELDVGAAGAARAHRPGATAPSPGPTVLDEPPGRRAFLRVRVPKDHLVVGESVPVTIRAYVKAGTAGTIQGLPRLNDDAFLVEGLDDDPVQSRTEIRGTPYATLTWRGRLTPLVAGDHAVAAEVPATLEWRDVVREEVPRRGLSSLFDAFFDDPFFGRAPTGAAFGGSPFGASPFGTMATLGLGRARAARVTLEDGAGTITVTEPPAEGRPAGYDGAVGRFTLEASAAPTSTRLGEPITLRLVVRGEGDLDRVHHAMLPEDLEGARVYPVTSRTDEAAHERVFEQAVTPTRAGALVLPSLALPFYDPEAQAYATARSEPVTIEVAPAPDGAVALGDAAASSAMAPDANAPGTFVSTLAPNAPWLPWLFGLVMGLAVAGGVALRRRDPAAARAHRASRRAIRAARRAMREAARRNDPVAYYPSAVRLV